jgi:hypothetical protein
MKEKVESVLKVLNLQIEQQTTKEIEKFINRFKSIFQDYFNAIFIFTDLFRDKVKDRLLNQIKSYEIFQTDLHKSQSESKLDDIIQDLNRKPFRNLIETLFKLCMYMILHDPVLSFNISKYPERQLVYHFYNKNDLMNIEGFGTDQTPCAVIIPTPLLRKNFAYMGIKLAVYCLQKSQVNDKILAECNKNKPSMLKRNSSADLLAEKGISNQNHIKQSSITEKENSTLLNKQKSDEKSLDLNLIEKTNMSVRPYGVSASTPKKSNSNSISHPVKVKNKTSEDLSNMNIIQSSTNLVHNQNSNYNKENRESRENSHPQQEKVNSNISGINQNENNFNRSNLLPLSSSFVNNNNYTYNQGNSSINKIAQDEEGVSNNSNNNNPTLEGKNKIPQSGKKCYDKPLIMKTLKKDEEMAIPHKRTYAGSFVNSYKHIDLDQPSLQTYKTNTLNLKKNNSRSSSIDNSNSNIVQVPSINETQLQSQSHTKERPLISHLHLQNIQPSGDSIHYTKTTRGFNTKNLLETEGNNNNTIPIRYVPTNNGFNMIRAKNNPSKQGFISDSGKRLNSNSVLEKSTHGHGNADYPHKEQTQNITSKTIANKNEKDDCENLDYNMNNLSNTPLIERHHERNEEIKRKHLNNYLNHNHGSLNRDREKDNSSNQNNQNTTPLMFNLNRKNYIDSNGNLKFIGNSYLNLNLNSNLAKTAPKDRKMESRIFCKTPTPNELFQEAHILKTEEIINYNLDSKGREIKDNSGISYSNTSENNLTDDMKYNAPKKKRDEERTPVSNKLNPQLDIKSRVGKIYNDHLQQQKTIDHPSGSGDKYSNNINMNPLLSKDSSSPKSLHTFSNVNEKTAKEMKEKKLVFLSNTGKLKFGSSIYSNLQNKAMKK